MLCCRTLIAAAMGLTLVATSGQAQLSSIPSYYDHLQFNLTSPGAYSTAVGGYANPAIYGTMPGSELQFSWSDEGNSFGSMGDWGLFFGSTNVGLGIVRDEIRLPSGQRAGVNDYRLGFSGGEDNTTLGLSFGWSGGDGDLVGRSDLIQVGLVQRTGRYASVGLVGNFALNNSNQSGLFDLAIRPLGDSRVTVFGDLELPKGVGLGDAPWSLGAVLEPVPGVMVAGRYFENESYAFSVGFNFGGGLRVAGQPRFDKDNNTTNTTYEIRGGFQTRSFMEDALSKEKSYLKLDLHGRVKYRAFKYFDSNSHSLQQLLADLEYAKNDPAVAGVVLSLSGAKINRAMAWEIREKLQDVKASGKHVVIFVDNMTMTEYHLASVADRIVMDPEGALYIPGYILGRTFVSDMLAKIGIGFDEWRFFKYKSAAEGFSRTSMSEADREQRYALIEDWYATIREEASASRNVSGTTFDSWVNEDVFFHAPKALEAGLVDQLGRMEEVKDAIEELEGDKKRYLGRDDLAGNRLESTLWGEDPEIAVVYALGVCAMDTGIRARQLEKIFQRLRDDRNVKAVVFRVDSPGGDGMASDVVAAAIEKCRKKKPVIISQGFLAASGGYWISMNGSEIYALPQTVTGSIGVIGGWIWNDGIGEKLGHTVDFVKVGEKADLGYGIRFLLSGPMLPERNLTEEEQERVKKEMLQFYENFVGKVAKGRGMTTEAVKEVAQGHVFSGVDGLDVGLVDKIGGLDVAIEAARAAAGIEPDERIEVVEYPKWPPFNFGVFHMRPFSFFGFSRDGADADAELDYFEHPEWVYLRMIADYNGRPLFLLPPEYVVPDRQSGW